MKHTPYGVAIVGAGWVAKEYLHAFGSDPRAEIVGVYSRTRRRAEQMLADHGLTATSYGSLAELLDDDRVNIVVSCTPPDVRADHVVPAARSGRHVVIEKPVATSIGDTLAIRDAVVEAGVHSTTSFVLRWNERLARTKELVDEGWVGDIVHAEANYWHPIQHTINEANRWRFGQGMDITAFVSGGCHAVDMLRFLCGDIATVTAVGGKPRAIKDFAFPPAVSATLQFVDGGVGLVSAVLEGETPYSFNTRIIGTRGSIRDGEMFASHERPEATEYWPLEAAAPNSGDVADHPFAAEARHFLDCIENDIPSHAAITDTWKTMATCFAIDESVRAEGAPVAVLGSEPS